MLNFKHNSLHWKIASFFWYWSLFRESSYQRHNNLCHHFWWTMSSWLMPIVTVVLIILGLIVGSYISFGILLHSLYGIFLYAPILMADGSLMEGKLPAEAAAFFGYFGLIVQCFIWRLFWMTWRDIRHKQYSFLPAIIHAGYTGMKENFCPIITWKD